MDSVVFDHKLNFLATCETHKTNNPQNTEGGN